MPGPGGTHRWLAQVASGLRNLLSAAQCCAFLRECCDEWVDHRPVPDSEIEAAVEFAYGDTPTHPINFGRSPVDWPEADPALIYQVLGETPTRFDADVDTGLQAAEVLPHLFRAGELVCASRTSDHALIRPLEESLTDAAFMQFIVVNPMRGRTALNFQRKPSPRCQNNVAGRRHLVAEFDDRNLAKARQAQLITRLAGLAPLVMVVDSGGKSLHAWFRVDHLGVQDHVRLFYTACLLGADATRWDICGWLRMPGGLRVVGGVPSVRQRILHFNPEPLNV